jgi:hypothetical protein
MLTTQMIGAAGEHFVLSQLLRRGLIAAQAPAGAPNCDLIVTDPEGQRLVAVQVKSIINPLGWPMNAKHEKLRSPTLFYVLVNFGTDLAAHPKSFVVPSAVVADVLARNHSDWLSKPGLKGQQRQDTDRRQILLKSPWLAPYAEAWHLLEQQADPAGQIAYSGSSK